MDSYHVLLRTLVNELPEEVLSHHDGSESLVYKITTLIYGADQAPKKRGRPAGSKNKPKDIAPATEVTETPKKRGRPAGSKNKPKDVAPAPEVTETPKKRGRPAGSKNKPKDVAPATEVTETPKKRGRPAGSKNKPKLSAPDAPKKRGRPTGSKNKSKTPSTPQHTRKSKKSTAAATVIQRAWRASRPTHPICGNRCIYGCCKKQTVDFLGTMAENPAPKKRSPDKHTRKSKRSTAAATTIQRYARRYINEYHVLLAVHTAQ